MTNTAVTETKPTNTMALVGFILSLAGFIVGITAIPGIVLGHVGLHQIKKTGEQGHGLGVAALVLGYIQVGLGLLAVVLLVILFIVLGPTWIDHYGGPMLYNDNA